MSVGFQPERARALIDILSPDRLTRVVDIGANPLDETPYKGLLSIGGCDVWGFEPQAGAYDKLMAAKGAHEHYICAAVGTGEPAELKVCSDVGFTSLLEPSRRFVEATGQFADRMRVVDRIEVETSRLDDLEELPEFDLLKIDIQGSELAVFQNGAGKLSKALAVITEVTAVPMYEGQPVLADQLTELGQHGFLLHKFLFLKEIGFRNPWSARLKRSVYRSQLGDGDAVMVRGLLDLQGLEDEELKHLAILCDSVLLTQDLGVTAMVELMHRGVIQETQLHDYMDLLPGAGPRPAETAAQ
ncbi:FkbM family methyltransferase [Gymnodinialimonas ceratoperidinii]|uniref:FkbM family methyltransferase n=1 Tax=Gymnodinialimonas ceratoperidinii TaxID=2856823 RepID=A0A8F6YBP6_9RHOB|nr:FkbM family methyltransferase [Gymnodinialimonas ceratoperidinii]QXT38410.1 FkbM family methyltransferase [Gymnodinialimonas ceratoperidinii]